MRVYRKVGEPNRYQVIAQDPRPLPANSPSTFPVNLPVKAGDLLGLGAQTGMTGCLFDAPGETGNLWHTPSLAVGESGDFTDFGPYRVNVSAVVNPVNTFVLGKVTTNRKKGTASVSVQVPNPGQVSLAGKGVKAASAGAHAALTVSSPGTVQLPIKAQGKKRSLLNRSGKAKLAPTITYTPTGGDPSTQSLTVRLKKKLKK